MVWCQSSTQKTPAVQQWRSYILMYERELTNYNSKESSINKNVVKNMYFIFRNNYQILTCKKPMLIPLQYPTEKTLISTLNDWFLNTYCIFCNLAPLCSSCLLTVSESSPLGEEKLHSNLGNSWQNSLIWFKQYVTDWTRLYKDFLGFSSFFSVFGILRLKISGYKMNRDRMAQLKGDFTYSLHVELQFYVSVGFSM